MWNPVRDASGEPRASRDGDRDRGPLNGRPLRAAWYAVPLPPHGTDLVAVRLFGERMVLWRGVQEWMAAPAACPHAGADLATGVVRGGALECPWHGRAFGVDGDCQQGAGTPGLIRRPTRARGDQVWVWGGVGEAPPWEPPRDEDAADWAVCGTYEETVTASLVEVFENVADLEHFGPVHGSIVAPVVTDAAVDGHQLHLRMLHRLRSGHTIPVRMRADGPGVTITWFGDPAWLRLDTHHLPLDGRLTAVRCRGLARGLQSRPSRAALVRGVFAEMHEQLRQDERIWAGRDPSIDRRAGGALTTVRAWLTSFC